MRIRVSWSLWEELYGSEVETYEPEIEQALREHVKIEWEKSLVE